MLMRKMLVNIGTVITRNNDIKYISSDRDELVRVILPHYNLKEDAIKQSRSPKGVSYYVVVNNLKIVE